MRRLLTLFVLGAVSLLTSPASLALGIEHEPFTPASRIMGGFVLAAVSLVVFLVLCALTSKGSGR